MRIVVKIGTNVLTGDFNTPQSSIIQRLMGEIFALRKMGHEVILVSSGAVGTGWQFLPKLDADEGTQIWAAIGQPVLMRMYSEAATEFGAQVGQVLILRSELTDRQRYDTLVNVLNAMLKSEVLPVINGNDVISLADLLASDNDLLAGMVAIATGADKLVILTNQEGLFTADPNLDKNAKLVKEVKNIDFEFERLCSNTKSAPGRGGMLSKVRAAKHAANAGIETYIVDGRQKDILQKVFLSESVGTKVLAGGNPEMTRHKRWLLAAKGFGQIIVDGGAVKALRNFKSLLFPGIVSARGLFGKGEIVEVIDKTGLAVAYGKANYDQGELFDALAIKKTHEKNLKFAKEVIHCDHMAVIKSLTSTKY